MTSGSNLESSGPLADLSFLVGEWKGIGRYTTRTGTFDFPTHMICLRSVDRDGLQLSRFDDSASEKMFYAEQLHFFRDDGGQLRAKREGFDYTHNGDSVVGSVEDVTPTGDGFTIQSESGPEDRMMITEKYSKEGMNGLKMKGTVKAGNVSWSMEYGFERRVV